MPAPPQDVPPVFWGHGSSCHRLWHGAGHRDVPSWLWVCAQWGRKGVSPGSCPIATAPSPAGNDGARCRQLEGVSVVLSSHGAARVQGCTGGGANRRLCRVCTQTQTRCTQIFAPSPSHTHTFLPLRACTPPRIGAHVPPERARPPMCTHTDVQAHGQHTASWLCTRACAHTTRPWRWVPAPLFLPALPWVFLAPAHALPAPRSHVAGPNLPFLTPKSRAEHPGAAAARLPGTFINTG